MLYMPLTIFSHHEFADLCQLDLEEQLNGVLQSRELDNTPASIRVQPLQARQPEPAGRGSMIANFGTS